MNKRIEEILNQPVFSRLKDFYDCGPVHKATIEEFVNAIVQECVNLLKKESERLYTLASGEENELRANDFEICAEKCWDNEVMIKEHFGVKE